MGNFVKPAIRVVKIYFLWLLELSYWFSNGYNSSYLSCQILLEDCHLRGLRCRIICTQPCRLAAHANADRVAQERGEIVGQSVGYQIRLESK